MKKILLVDDMPAVRSAISRVLKSAGHDVIEVDDGDVAIERIGREQFDLVVTDIMMPTVDGGEVVAALKSRADAPPVIAMSGGSAGIPADVALGAASSRADAVLKKPFENNEILEAVNRLT